MEGPPEAQGFGVLGSGGATDASPRHLFFSFKQSLLFLSPPRAVVTEWCLCPPSQAGDALIAPREEMPILELRSGNIMNQEYLQKLLG